MENRRLIRPPHTHTQNSLALLPFCLQLTSLYSSPVVESFLCGQMSSTPASCSGWPRVQMSTQIQTTLTENLHVFPQSLQKNAGIVGQIRPHRFLEHPIQLIIYTLPYYTALCTWWYLQSFHTQEIIRRIVVVKQNVINDRHFWLIYVGQKDSGGEDSSRLKREVCKSPMCMKNLSVALI